MLRGPLNVLNRPQLGRGPPLGTVLFVNNWISHWCKVSCFHWRALMQDTLNILQARATNTILNVSIPIILFLYSERIQHRSTTVVRLTGFQGSEPSPWQVNAKTEPPFCVYVGYSVLSCTRLRILLNTICRKPGFNSLRTPLNHGAEQASNETLKQTQQRNWSNACQGGQTALKEHLAVLHSEIASTTQLPRGEHRGTIKDCKIAGATTWQGQGNHTFTTQIIQNQRKTVRRAVTTNGADGRVLANFFLWPPFTPK